MRERPDREPSRDINQLKLIWPFVMRYKGMLLLALVFLVLGAVATLALPVAVRHMIDLGFAPEQSGQIARWFLLLFGVALLMALFTGLRYYWVTRIGQHVVADLREAVYERIMRLSQAFFEETRTGEVLSRINTDTTLVETVVGSTFSITLRSGFMLVGAAIMMIVTSPKLAAMIGLLLPLILIPILVAGRVVRRLSKQNQDRIADASAIATETINAVHTVQAYAQTGREIGRFNTSVREALATAIRRIRAETLMAMAVVTLVFGGIVGVLWLGANDVIDGRLSAGELSQFVLYAVMAASTAGALSQVYGELKRAAGAMERISEILGMTPDIASPERPRVPITDNPGRIELQNLSFAYPSRPDLAVLSNLNLVVEPGETVALVGPSGAGKSTLFQLLLRFYDPTQGQLLLDGIDVRQWDLDALRARFALVAQQVTIFSTDARENIRYGQPDCDDQRLIDVARAAHAEEFIERLQDGYDTYLGERGVGRSRGPAQRLSIARALLTNPHVLLLDEATSALDAESERLVQEALNTASEGRTTLVIAHRLATVRRADRIVMLDQGRIAAEGSHEKLLEESSLYRHLAELQFLA